jgi:C1A family cysteine protease
VANVYGCKPKTDDVRDHLARAARPYTGAFVDLSGAFPAPPWNQGQLGSCVPHGGGAAFELARAKQGLPPLSPPSFLFLYYQGRVRAGYPLAEDTGLQIRDVFKVMSKDGVAPGSDWPYEVDRFAEQPPVLAYQHAGDNQAMAYGSVARGDIDAMIASGYPVVTGFEVYASFESAETAATGVAPVPDKAAEELVGRHCIVICSTPKAGSEIPGADAGRFYRKCRNSWGHDGSWGLPDQPGYFWMPVEVLADPGTVEFWQVTTVEDPARPVAPVPAAGGFNLWLWLWSQLRRAFG